MNLLDSLHIILTVKKLFLIQSPFDKIINGKLIESKSSKCIQLIPFYTIHTLMIFSYFYSNKKLKTFLLFDNIGSICFSGAGIISYIVFFVLQWCNVIQNNNIFEMYFKLQDIDYNLTKLNIAVDYKAFNKYIKQILLPIIIFNSILWSIAILNLEIKVRNIVSLILFASEIFECIHYCDYYTCLKLLEDRLNLLLKNRNRFSSQYTKIYYKLLGIVDKLNQIYNIKLLVLILKDFYTEATIFFFIYWINETSEMKVPIFFWYASFLSAGNHATRFVIISWKCENIVDLVWKKE